MIGGRLFRSDNFWKPIIVKPIKPYIANNPPSPRRGNASANCEHPIPIKRKTKNLRAEVCCCRTARAADLPVRNRITAEKPITPTTAASGASLSSQFGMKSGPKHLAAAISPPIERTIVHITILTWRELTGGKFAAKLQRSHARSRRGLIWNSENQEHWLGQLPEFLLC